MQTYEIPRNYKGESRILYIFSVKALAYTGIGVVLGGIFYFIFKLLGLQMIGIGIVIFLGLLGFCIGTFKVPDSKKFKLTEKTGGEAIDDVIKNWNKFLMVIECQGVNYDLMSGLEKNSVEQGFLQFLNTLRYPVQIYVQTRTVNLESGIIKYKERINEIKDRLLKKRM